MKVINAYTEILTPINGKEILKHIELCGRVCYKSEKNTTKEGAEKFVRRLIKRGHESVIEHFSISVRFVCDRGVSHEIVRHRISSFSMECLTGDSVVRSFVSNTRHRGKCWTIKQLYDWQFDTKRKGRLKLIRVRSVDDLGRIVPNTVEEVVYSGKKEVYEVTTKSGRKIKSTMNHLYYTPAGYKHLAELTVGSRIYANGLPALNNEEFLRENYLKKNMTRKQLAETIGCCEATLYKAFVKFGIRKPWSDRPNRHPGHGVKGMFSDEQRKQISERMTLENNPQWKGDSASKSAGYLRSNRHYKRGNCWGCGRTDKVERHHMDKNPLNNAESNCMDLCQKCHKAFHKADIKSVFSDEIVSIALVGIEDTFDIVLQNSPHNFVANGLVVHNSTRYVNYGKENECTFILPRFWSLLDATGALSKEFAVWCEHMYTSEDLYLNLLKNNATPEQARSVLPHSLKTELIMTANLREWRHFFKMRTSAVAHPSLREVATPLLAEFKQRIPIVFDDIKGVLWNGKDES